MTEKKDLTYDPDKMDQHIRNAKELLKDCKNIVARQEKRIAKAGRGLRQCLSLLRQIQEEDHAQT